MDLDATDRDLLAALLEDARISQRGLAKRVGVAQGTITNRLRRLEEMGVIKGYTVLLDAESIGWTMTVITGLIIQKGSMIDVQQQIAADPRVFAVYDVTGDYDSMVLARVQGRKDLDDLTKTVFTLEGVQRSFTQVVLNTVKEDGRVVPAEERID
jgi:DNA-binding Lrp family transcriptional regulator